MKSSFTPSGKSFFRQLIQAAFIVFLVGFVSCFIYYWYWWSNAVPYPITFDRDEYTEAAPPDLPVLNSIVDNPDYNEFHFLEIIDPELDGPNYLPTSLEANHEYEVHIYCRNDANSIHDDEENLATDVRLTVDLPAKYTARTKSRFAKGYYIFCDRIGAAISYYNGVDSAPQIVTAYAEIFSNETLRLEYVPDSAKIISSGDVDGQKLSKQLFRPQGILLGYDALDGGLPSGRECACIVSFRFRASSSIWGPLDELRNTYFRP